MTVTSVHFDEFVVFWQDLNWCLVFVRAMFSQNFISFVFDSADSHTYITYS